MNHPAKIALLLFFFLLCGAAIVVTHLAEQRIPAPASRELYSIVERQLADLRAANFDSAYQHAAAVVQQKFSRADFERLIRRDFVSLTEAEHVEFGAVRVNGGAAFMQVFLASRDGTPREFLYSFSAESDGWKINGVQPRTRAWQQRAPGLHI